MIEFIARDLAVEFGIKNPEALLRYLQPDLRGEKALYHYFTQNKWPNYRYALARLAATCYLAQGEEEKYVFWMIQAISCFPRGRAAFRELMDKSLANQDWRGVYDLAKAALKLSACPGDYFGEAACRDDEVFYLPLSQAAFHLDFHDEALSVLTKALEKNPESPALKKRMISLQSEIDLAAKCLVSVIIPVYQGEKYLNRCLDSVLAQTFSHYEVIIVNDGSTDGSQKIIDSYGAQFKRLSCHYQENQGIIRATEKAISHIQGEFVLFIDQDDWIKPETLDILYGEASRHHADLVKYNYISYVSPQQQTPVQSTEYTTAMWSHLISAQLLRNLDFSQIPSVNFAQDWILSSLIYLEQPKSIKLEDYLYYHFHNPASVSRNLDESRLADIKSCYRFVSYKFALEGLTQDHIFKLFAWRTLILSINMDSQVKKELEAFFASPAGGPAPTLPLVSILIPAYNKVEFFREALESALSQTYPHIEIMISDNSRGDQVKSLVESYQSTYMNIFYQDNRRDDRRGHVQNFQNCVEMAQGEYISYLFDDDLYFPQRVEKMVAKLISDDSISLVASNRKIILAGQGEVSERPSFQKDQLMTGDAAGRKLLFNFDNFIGEPTTIMFRKADLADFGGMAIGYFESPQRFYTDLPLFLKLAAKGDFFFYQEELSVFRKHNQQATANHDLFRWLVIDYFYLIANSWENDLFIRSRDELKRLLAKWSDMYLFMDPYFKEQDLVDPCKSVCTFPSKLLSYSSFFTSEIWEKLKASACFRYLSSKENSHVPSVSTKKGGELQEKQGRKYFLTICAIAREEARYLDEWIAYHVLKGVEQIYLKYDHQSPDLAAAKAILKKWVDNGVVEVEYGETKGQQKRFYADKTINQIQYEAQWCAYIDLDEFLWSNPEEPDDYFIDLLMEYQTQVDAIELEWLFFGSNGEEEYRDELLVTRFSRHQKPEDHIILTPCDVKTILNFNENIKKILDSHQGEFPHCHTLFSHHHLRRLRGDFSIIDLKDDQRKRLRTFRLDHFALAHFYCKSKEEFALKCGRPSADSGMDDRNFIHQLHNGCFFEKRDTNEAATHALSDYAGKISEKINEMEDILVVYHAAFMGKGKEIFFEQLDLLQSTGLAAGASKLLFTLVGPITTDISTAIEQLPFREKVEITYHEDYRVYELPSMDKIQELANSYPNAKICYIHTKGASHGVSQTRNSTLDEKKIKNLRSWRKVMEYFIMEKWEDCVKTLYHFDACGYDWGQRGRDPKEPAYFSGNFWWATGAYLQRCYLIDRSAGACETFIGTGKPRVHNFLSSINNPRLKDYHTPEEIQQMTKTYPFPCTAPIFNYFDYDYQEKYYRDIPFGKQAPAISLIIPTYQGETYLKKCLDSALSQTFHEYEVIVVNDGSTDGTRAILDEYFAAHPDLVLMEQENQGIIRASEAGLKAAKGEYVLFMDHDDWLYENALEVLHKQITFKACDVLYYNHFREIGGNKVPTEIKIGNYPMWSKLIRTDLLRRIDFSALPSISYGGDFLLTTLMETFDPVMVKVDDFLYCRVIHDQSFTNRPLSEKFLLDHQELYSYLVMKFAKMGLLAEKQGVLHGEKYGVLSHLNHQPDYYQRFLSFCDKMDKQASVLLSQNYKENLSKEELVPMTLDFCDCLNDLSREGMGRLKHADHIPIIIVVYNNVTYLKNMLRQLAKLQVKHEHIWIWDNNSTHPELDALYEKINHLHPIVKNKSNHGPRFFVKPEYLDLLPHFFAVTDPDLGLNPDMPQNFLETLKRLTLENSVFKAGLALDISPHKDFNDELKSFNGYTIRGWESKFWTKPLPQYENPKVYEAEVDTTFAVYNQDFLKNGFANAVRVAGDFTCRHLPWYKNDFLSQAEWKLSQSPQWGWWNKSAMPMEKPAEEIYVVYHIALMTDWQEIVSEQLQLLEDSRLGEIAKKIYIQAVGANGQEDESALMEILEHHSLLDVCQLTIYPSLKEYEFPSIKKVQAIAAASPASKILYFHTKGASHGLKGNINSRMSRTEKDNSTQWRKFMGHYNITKWEECVDALHDFDICGVDWGRRIPTKVPFFPGNFWWARGEYVNTCTLNTNNRYDCESFIGTGHPRVMNFLQSHDNIHLKKYLSPEEIVQRNSNRSDWETQMFNFGRYHYHDKYFLDT